MKKNKFGIEWVFLAVCFIVTGVAMMYKLKPPKTEYGRLIKWSDEISLEATLINSTKRLFPSLAESRALSLILPENFKFSPSYLASTISSSTLLPAKISDIAKNQIVLDPNKKRSISLEILLDEKYLEDISAQSYFDPKSMNKILEEINEKKFIKGYLFSLYQTEKDYFKLEIIKIKKVL
jgi:hypothetical protein